jgi:metal-responsive CopG/Arc/MetJ family transcriptional regulator
MKTKMKTSLTLSREVVRGIDRVAEKKRSRSAVADDVLRGYLSHRERAAANARDFVARVPSVPHAAIVLIRLDRWPKLRKGSDR